VLVAPGDLEVDLVTGDVTDLGGAWRRALLVEVSDKLPSFAVGGWVTSLF
jgi:hypothetical protein